MTCYRSTEDNGKFLCVIIAALAILVIISGVT